MRYRCIANDRSLISFILFLGTSSFTGPIDVLSAVELFTTERLGCGIVSFGGEEILGCGIDSDLVRKSGAAIRESIEATASAPSALKEGPIVDSVAGNGAADGSEAADMLEEKDSETGRVLVGDEPSKKLDDDNNKSRPLELGDSG